MTQPSSTQFGSLKRLPLWTYRVMPIRWVRWIYRDELERGQRATERIRWSG